MNTTKIIIALLIGNWALTSCSPAYYAPNSHNVPLLERKGDATIQALKANDGKIEIQGSCAASNNIGIMLNLLTISDSHSDYSPGNDYIPPRRISNSGSGHMTELGIGYYTNIHSNTIFEIYGIAGIGSMENSFSNSNGNNSGSLKADISKYALQGNLGYRNHFLEIAVSLKPTFIQFSNIAGNLIIDNKGQNKYLSQNAQQFIMESAITARVGYKNIKLQLQVGSGNQNHDTPIDERSKYFSAGIFLNLNLLEKPESGNKNLIAN